MAKYTNELGVKVNVQYRKVGKTYNVSAGDGAGFDNGTETSYPFDEVSVEPGQTVDLGDITWMYIVSPFAAEGSGYDSFLEWQKQGTNSN